MSRGGVRPQPTLRMIEGIPGTVEPGFRERPIVEHDVPRVVREAYQRQTGSVPEEWGLRLYEMGPCTIMVGREPPRGSVEPLWHLTISTPSRHPTWDEIKVARYRLLPLDIAVAIYLPPPKFYVNVPEQDHVFQLWETRDPERSWEGM